MILSQARKQYFMEVTPVCALPHPTALHICPGVTSEYVRAPCILPPDLELPTCPNRALSYHRYLPKLLFLGTPGLTSFGFPSSLSWSSPSLSQEVQLIPSTGTLLALTRCRKGIPISVFSSSCGLISLSQQLCRIAALIPIS